jgi:hypothetical protein
MAVTVIERPEGHKLDTVINEATALNDGSGTLFLYNGSTPHGLSTGDYIYVESNFDNYNGFKYVEKYDNNTLKLRIYPFGQFTQYVQDEELRYYKTTLKHGYQCVHLPIVYNTFNDKVPNVVDPVSFVGGVGSDNGNLLLNVDLMTITALDYVLLQTPEGYNVHQVISAVNTSYTELVLNVPLSYYTGFISVQKYYNNYFVTVEVWAGLESGHRWAGIKPFRLATTLKLIPDSFGKTKFSISEILKGYIDIKNNLTQNSLPNNIDFLTEFYIKVNENYDISDGTTITQYTGPVSDDSDTFVGQALNSKLPFKTISQGYMSDYIDSSTENARWLTTQERPQAYVDRFFDLSFIHTYLGSNVVVTILKKLNGAVLYTDVITYTNPGSGILRVPITPESGFDEYCVQSGKTGSTLLPASGFANLSGPGFNWLTVGSTKKVTLTSIGVSDILRRPYVFKVGVSYTIVAAVTLTGSAPGQLTLRVQSQIYVPEASKVDAISGTTQTITLTFTPTVVMNRLVTIEASRTSSTSSRTVALTGMTISSNEPLTEQICINIVDECQTFVDDNLRLTEDVRLRELE